MSDNSQKPSYRPLSLIKTSYSSNGTSTIIKSYNVRSGQNKGKIAYVNIKIKANGEKSYSIKYSDLN